ncbi:MAG: hypothetical protein ACRBDL_06120 [Alphaproteobacteria bacterium]
MALKGDHSYFEGRVGDIDFSFAQPVSPHAETQISEFLTTIFPEDEVKVSGQLCAKESEMQLMGHYHIQVNDQDFVACIGRVGDDQCAETLSVGHQVFNHYRDQGIAVFNSVPFSQAGANPDGNDWVRNAQEQLGTIQMGDKNLAHYVHLEEYPSDIQTLMEVGVEGYHEKLGALVGAVYNAGEVMDENLQDTLQQATDQATLHYVNEGIQITERYLHSLKDGKSGTSAIFDKSNDDFDTRQDGFNASFSPARQQEMLEYLEGFKENPRVPTAFNMIEKTIWVQGNEDLAIACCDTPSRGYLPMMTENSSYDLGQMVHRIILDERRYNADEPTDMQDKIRQGLQDFVQGYNNETGLDLTVDEALDAGQRAFAFSSLQIPGLYALGEIEITSSLDTHLEQTLDNIMQSIDKIEMYRDASVDDPGYEHP